MTFKGMILSALLVPCAIMGESSVDIRTQQPEKQYFQEESTQDISDSDWRRVDYYLSSALGATGATGALMSKNKFAKAGAIVGILGCGMAAAVVYITSSRTLRKYSNLSVESVKRLHTITDVALGLGGAGMIIGVLQMITQDIKPYIFPG